MLFRSLPRQGQGLTGNSAAVRPAFCTFSASSHVPHRCTSCKRRRRSLDPDQLHHRLGDESHHRPSPSLLSLSSWHTDSHSPGPSCKCRSIYSKIPGSAPLAGSDYYTYPCANPPNITFVFGRSTLTQFAVSAKGASSLLRRARLIVDQISISATWGRTRARALGQSCRSIWEWEHPG